MSRIVEFDNGPAPPSLAQWRAEWLGEATPAWNEIPSEVKHQIRKALHRAQRGLCCYCYRRIADDEAAHIEHVNPQDDTNRFDWFNLALACEGGNLSGLPATCDHAKGQKPLRLVHPYRKAVFTVAEMRESGDLRGSDELARSDVEDVLNLNARHLRDARRSALRACLVDLSGRRLPERGAWTARSLQSAVDELDRLKRPREFQPFLEGWLRRQLRQRPA